MKHLKIVFLDANTLGKDVSFEPISSLGEYKSYESTLPEQVIERISGYDVVITNKVYMGRKEIDSSPELKLICVAATGMNNVDLEYARLKEISVKNAIDYSTESVVQVTFMHILNLVGKAHYFDEYVKNGEYSESGCFTNAIVPFAELKGKKLGIIGLGHIGSRVAEIGAAFGMQIAYYPTSGIAHSDKYQAYSLEKLLSECDIISIHAPLNERTKNLVGYKELEMMKPQGLIINMGRGGIINEADLIKALNDNLIAGAATDVFTKEPLPAGHPYFSIKDKGKLLLTPHIGWASREARKCLIQKIADNIRYM
ncbi:MAG: D-2-hydroxyacid dehydrogenase [Bacteroidales bacterium]|nr:D-2-hydroxyacid dehydrogenase [Bacteroidales bacterium]MDD4671055.1 D-2-hydroxyacid dehydrogenase [Bacteroidales bacterium]